MNATSMLRTFCDAVEQHDGDALAALFTEDGVYHDAFYGAFEGRTKVAELIDDWFYRTATDFRWDMHDPVSDGKTLYARYTFSYRSILPEANNARAMFEGVAIMTLRDGKIASYHEVANTATGFCRHEFRTGAHRQDRRQAGRGAEGAPGDEAASGGVSGEPRYLSASLRARDKVGNFANFALDEAIQKATSEVWTASSLRSSQ